MKLARPVKTAALYLINFSFILTLEAPAFQVQLEELHAPRFVTDGFNNMKVDQFVLTVLVPILEGGKYEIQALEEKRGVINARCQEYKVVDGWQAGADERVTFQIRAEPTFVAKVIRFRIYIDAIRTERKGGNAPQWQTVRKREGPDPLPQLVRKLKKGTDSAAKAHK